MKLLIITQKVDRLDPVLGFFHGWITEFAKRFESITVICLQKGDYSLPANVKVLSLGKEEKRSRLQYISRFYSYIWKERNNYDAVFVHMNEEYVLLAGWLWQIMGKKVYMWRNHHAGTVMTDIAASFCDKALCTSRYSYTAKYRKTVLMPVGIDMNLFKPENPHLGSSLPAKASARKPNSFLFLGRIAPTKNIHMFIDTLGILKEKGITFSAHVYGDALVKDAPYVEELKSQTRKLSLESVVKFKPGVPNHETPLIYSVHEIFVNLSSSGMYDKTIFEAMACGCLVVASNDNLKGNIDERLIIDAREPEEIARALATVLSLSSADKQRIISENMRFAETQSLSNLSIKLASLLQE